MKKLAYILSFFFLAFIAAPSIIAYIDNNADVSVAFNVNEEESSSKNQLTLEFDIQEHHGNYESIHFLQEQKESSHYYDDNYAAIFLDVVSPPPQNV